MKTEKTRKKCKQCGNTLDIEKFRQYPPRGNNKYKTTQGHYTICKECEAFNRHAVAAWRADPRTARQQDIVDAAIRIYTDQIARGLHPVGALAKSLMASGPYEAEVKQSIVDRYITENLPPEDANTPDAAEEIVEQLRKLQAINISDYSSEQLGDYEGDVEKYEEDLHNIMGDKLTTYQSKLINALYDSISEARENNGDNERVKAKNDEMLKESAN